MTPIAAPLVVTLRMESAAAARFTALRQAHFPAHRNWLDAHITLFHALPGERLQQVLEDVTRRAAVTSPFILHVDRVLFLGGGVAYAIASADAEQLRRTLAEGWEALLSRQDRAWHGPLHITVQNKVPSTVARALHDERVRDFAPERILATGLDVWHYEGGPWRLAASVPFNGTGVECANRLDT